MRRLLTATAALACASALAGCGVGPQATPQPLSAKDIPFDLLSKAPTTTSTTEPSPEVAQIFLEGPHGLRAVRRTIRGAFTVGNVLDQLAAGPTPQEASLQLTSPVSSAAPFSVGPVKNGTVDVDVAASFANLGGQSQIVAAAQLVFTATGVPGVQSIMISVGGQPTQVPTADGSLSQGPLDRADYASLG